MRSFRALLWLLLVSSMSHGRVIKEGEIVHFIEVFLYENDNVNDQIEFAITTFNESLEIIDGVDGSVDEYGTISPPFRLSPLGDAFQIHSFVRFGSASTDIISGNKYEPPTASNFEYINYENSFTYRNLVFQNKQIFTSQKIQSADLEPFNFTIDENEAFPGYFPENNTLFTIVEHCFNNATCGIDRDTGILEIFDQSKGNQTSYMYRAFNFSVPWECGSQFCNFTNLMTGENYKIPPDLKTFSGEYKNKRLALVPLLTFESPLVVDQLNQIKNLSPNLGKVGILMALGFFLNFI